MTPQNYSYKTIHLCYNYKIIPLKKLLCLKKNLYLAFEKEMNISQNEFADRIKIDRSNFSKHINGKLPISDSLLNKIVVSLGISKEWLNSGEGEKYYMAAHRQTISLPTNVIHTNGQRGAKVYDIDVTAGPIGRSLIFSTENLIGSIDVPFINQKFGIYSLSRTSFVSIAVCNKLQLLIKYRVLTN